MLPCDTGPSQHLPQHKQRLFPRLCLPLALPSHPRGPAGDSSGAQGLPVGDCCRAFSSGPVGLGPLFGCGVALPCHASRRPCPMSQVPLFALSTTACLSGGPAAAQRQAGVQGTEFIQPFRATKQRQLRVLYPSTAMAPQRWLPCSCGAHHRPALLAAGARVRSTNPSGFPTRITK